MTDTNRFMDPKVSVRFAGKLVVVIFLLRSLANFVSSYSFQRIGLGMTTDIRNDLYRQVLAQSSRFHAEHSSGELMSRIVNDVGLIQSSVSFRVVDMLQSAAGRPVASLEVLRLELFRNIIREERRRLYRCRGDLDRLEALLARLEAELV